MNIIAMILGNTFSQFLNESLTTAYQSIFGNDNRYFVNHVDPFPDGSAKKYIFSQRLQERQETIL